MDTSAGDSDATTRAKRRMSMLITDQFKKQGYKTVIKYEVPCTFPEKKYHADIGILFRSRQDFDFYHFFIIEIDGKVGHGTHRKDVREEARDNIFASELGKGIATQRIPLGKIVGEGKIEDEKLFNDYIYQDIIEYYVYPKGEKATRLSELNRKFAIELAESTKTTKCEGCKHPIAVHDLTGCDLRYATVAKKRCDCTISVFRSDE